MLEGSKIAVVIPCYNVEKHIEEVVMTLPDYIDFIILVDDNSSDDTSQLFYHLAKNDKRIIEIFHKTNKGVGAAMLSGFEEALKRKADLIVKMDGDGQMDPKYMKRLIKPILRKQAGFCKGNRFADFLALRSMPPIRRFGNLALSFLIKLSSGYWRVMDPTNGYFCIEVDTLRSLDFNRLSPRYFFESSLLIELYYTGTNIIDIPMPAIYRDEKSSMRIHSLIHKFSIKLIKAFIRRIVYRYFIYDFSVFSIYILLGLPLLSFGIIFGLVTWIVNASAGIPTQTGTIMVSVLPVILGFQMLLAWIQADIDSYKFFAMVKQLSYNDDE